MPFVLDASVVARWASDDENHPVAELALERVRTDEARVPSLWWFKVRNRLIVNERRGRLTRATQRVSARAFAPARYSRSVAERGRVLLRLPAIAAELARGRAACNARRCSCNCRTRRTGALAKLLTADAEIAEPPLTHVRGRINIAKVDNDRFAQRIFDAGKVERPKRIPLCHDHERGGAFGAKIGVLTKGNIGQDLPRLLNRLRIIGAYFRPGRLQSNNDVDCGRLADIVGVLLKGEP